MAKKLKDQDRFAGNGISYRAKIIGIEDVAEPRGDQMCQETILKLKELVKASGQHKQRIFVNITLEGLRIIDTQSMVVLHQHPVHQISFISRDATDSRAFGYVFGPGDGTHKFFGIKTANAAENLVLSLRDLFQTVYEMKKQEIEEAKAKAAAGTEGQGDGENINTESQVPPDGQAAEGQESIYQVPKNNAPVNPQEQEEAVANLLDLEDQVDTILKGIEQIKNLEFDDVKSEETPRQPSSSSPFPASPTSPPTAAGNDPWGVPMSGSSAAAPASSSLSDLQQLSNPPSASNPFALPGTPAPSVGITAPGFGMVQPGTNQPTAVPFGVPGQRAAAPQMMAAPGTAPFGAQFGQQPGFGTPFQPPVSGAVPGQPFPGAMTNLAAPGAQRGLARSPVPFAPFGIASPQVGMPMQMPPQAGQAADPFQANNDNLLQPMKPMGQEDQNEDTPPKSPSREALFGDLLDMKKSAGASSFSKTPKEMFKELAQPPKKSLNEIKGEAPAVSQANTSPFGDSF